MSKLDWTKLLGFESIGGCDLQDDIADARLGAKVGTEAWVACEEIADKKLGFQNETVSTKRGAKVGEEPF